MDREIKDEEAQNPPEVNKRLNDEKQSMVSYLNRFALSHCMSLHTQITSMEIV